MILDLPDHITGVVLARVVIDFQPVNVIIRVGGRKGNLKAKPPITVINVYWKRQLGPIFA